MGKRASLCRFFFFFFSVEQNGAIIRICGNCPLLNFLVFFALGVWYFFLIVTFQRIKSENAVIIEAEITERDKNEYNVLIS